MNCVVDLSVWISAMLSTERSHAHSIQFLRLIQNDGVVVICPEFTLIECAAAISRRTGNEQEATALIDLINAFPGLKRVGLSDQNMDRAIEMAKTRRLRAGDVIHVVVAEAYQAHLVTLDNEIIERSGLGLKALKPMDWVMRSKT